ncbi:metal-dependent phosphohydrolase [Aestuariicella hydrocarbonica]|uniref:Metal-dependent phosphohydrolase n=1 Tax=Pseudomaricurvus hydrocarbonicus TaxID=1470433 RepID=A0A9E5MPC3_9GAMM|nr:heme biosynthesis HemY N-terminal domain-containing protein [Aestuariicella hydrocarbonica]NHO67868.1 metal-dependent phosphohydrolase [Aestuariicella hydrocarbonica]
MKYFFLFVVCLLGGTWFYQWVGDHPSYLLVVVGKTSVEMSLWFALVCLLLLLFLYWVSHRILIGGARSVGKQVNRLWVGSERRAQKNTSAGLLSFIEGDWRPALRRLNRSAPNAQAPLLNYLAAARSAYELGDEQQANALLAKAEKADPNAGLAIALAQARMQMLGKKYESCAATLERARKLAPKHPVVLDMLRQVYVHLQDWESLEKILPQLRRQSTLSEEELTELTSLLYRKLLQRAGQSSSGVEAIQAVWHQIPKQWQSHPELLLIYVDLLEREGESSAAEVVLRKALQSDWNDQLILRYGLLRNTDASRQLLKAEGWVKERPGNSALLLTLGRLSMRNELWGKARDYFDHCLKIQASPEAYAEMARLLANLGEHESSTEYYQKGLLMTADQLPELPMPHH